MKIGFWSNFNGRGSSSTNAAMMALHLSLHYDFRVLVLSTQTYKETNIDSMFQLGDVKNGYAFSDTGLDTLQVLDRTGELTPDIFSNYASTIVPEKLDILYLRDEGQGTEEVIGLSMANIMSVANHSYDIVIADIGAGYNGTITTSVISKCDALVVNLPQGINEIKNFHRSKGFQLCMQDVKTFLCLSQYDPSAKITKKFVKTNLKMKEDVYCIPYKKTVKDCVCNRNLTKFFQVTRQLVPTNPNVDLFRELNSLAKALLIHGGYTPEQCISKLEFKEPSQAKKGKSKDKTKKKGVFSR